MRRIMIVAVSAACMCSCAHVRPTSSWGDLEGRLSAGQPVALTTADRLEVQGTVARVSMDSLTLTVNRSPRTFAAADVWQVRRNGDSLWNGLALGAAVGIAAAALPDNACGGRPRGCGHEPTAGRVAIAAGVTAVGVGIDALHRDKTVLYRSPAGVTIGFGSALSPMRRVLSIEIRLR